MMIDSKPINDNLHEFQDYIRHLQSKENQFSDEYRVSCLIDKLSPSWSTFAGDLHHKEDNLTLVQVLKEIHIEYRHRQNSKNKLKMKAKVDLVEDKPNHKFMNPKGKQLKKPKLLLFFSLCKLLFQTFSFFLFQINHLARRLMEYSAMLAGELTIWHPNASIGRRT